MNRILLPTMAYLAMFILFFFFTSTYALDMSIIQHHEEPKWRTDADVMSIFKTWLRKHGKASKGLDEMDMRFQIFKDNLKFIDEHNSLNSTYRLGLTRFADLTNEEYRATYLGTKPDPKRFMMQLKHASNRYSFSPQDQLPNSVDWRKKGAVCPVKDQGSCGSCWAFSAISAVESINQMTTGELISLSEQELVDCDAVNGGCNGGMMDDAFEYIIKNGGIDSDEHYPYLGKDGTCDPNKKSVVSIDGYEYVAPNNEYALKKAVAGQPVTVAIEASSRAFQLYQWGVFTGKCGINLDHGVTAVGYGTEGGKDYWIVRNSWGSGWGEEGYIRMHRNVISPYGKCGIAMIPSYPIKDSPNPIKMVSS